MICLKDKFLPSTVSEIIHQIQNQITSKSVKTDPIQYGKIDFAVRCKTCNQEISQMAMLTGHCNKCGADL